MFYVFRVNIKKLCLPCSRKLTDKHSQALLKEANYLPSTFRCNRNGRFVENRKKSANIWLCLRKSFQATLDPEGLFKSGTK